MEMIMHALRENSSHQRTSSTSGLGLFSFTPPPSNRNLSYEAYSKRIEALLSGIDVDRLAALINESRAQIEMARTRDLMLIIGRTGAGKSTTLNHLMGSRLEVLNDGGLDTSLQVASGETVYAEIGTDDNSKTLHPQIVPTREYSSELAYCDCPGFDDNRMQEENLCSNVSVPLAISYARGVRGLMLVIDCGDLTATKGNGFISLVDTILQLLKDPSVLLAEEGGIAKNILYVFTKVPAGFDINNIAITLERKKRSIEQQIGAMTARANEYEVILARLTGQEAQLAQAETNESKQYVLTTIIERMSALTGEEADSAKDNFNRLLRLNNDRAQLINQNMIIQMIIDNRANCFIVRGNEHDDKQNIINKLGELRRLPSIPKEHFSLDGRRAGPALLLEKVIEKIIEEGAQIFCENERTNTESTSLKKYIKLVNKEKRKTTSLLEKTRGLNQLTQAEFNEAQALLGNRDTLHTFVEQYLTTKSNRVAQFEQELGYLDSIEPKIYHHRNLGPVTFDQRQGAAIAAYVSTGLLVFPIGWALSLGSALATMMFGGARYAMAFVENASENARAHSVQWLLRRTHTFQYNDLPFLNISVKSDPPALHKVIPKGTDENWRSGLSMSGPTCYECEYDLYGESYKKGEAPNGFDLRTEVNEPDNGVYSINYVTDAYTQLSETIRVWVELHVERRLHPEVRPRISLIRLELLLPESEITNALQCDVQAANEIADADALTMTSLSYDDETAVKEVFRMLQERLTQYQVRLQTLGDALNSSTHKVENVHQRLQTQGRRFELVEQLLNVITVNNSYVTRVMNQYHEHAIAHGQAEEVDSDVDLSFH